MIDKERQICFIPNFFLWLATCNVIILQAIATDHLPGYKKMRLVLTLKILSPETDSFNVLTYEYIYNGGRVAIADVNNKLLQDIFFTGNDVPNKLYLNTGVLQFQDIDSKAIVNIPENGARAWLLWTLIMTAGRTYR